MISRMASCLLRLSLSRTIRSRSSNAQVVALDSACPKSDSTCPASRHIRARDNNSSHPRTDKREMHSLIPGTSAEATLISFSPKPTRSGRFRSSPAISPQMPIHFLRSEEHTSELQSRLHLVCRLLLEKKKTQI